MNVGGSMNFDGQAFLEEEEAELEREDFNREQELRELLANALPDDLLEEEEEEGDDDESKSSSPSSDGNRSPDDQSASSLNWGQQDAWQLPRKLGNNEMQQTSTPNCQKSPPPLQTPADFANLKSNAIKPVAHRQGVPVVSDNNSQNHFELGNEHKMYPPSHQPKVDAFDQHYDFSRREVEGSDYIEEPECHQMSGGQGGGVRMHLSVPEYPHPSKVTPSQNVYTYPVHQHLNHGHYQDFDNSKTQEYGSHKEMISQQYQQNGHHKGEESMHQKEPPNQYIQEGLHGQQYEPPISRPSVTQTYDPTQPHNPTQPQHIQHMEAPHYQMGKHYHTPTHGGSQVGYPVISISPSLQGDSRDRYPAIGRTASVDLHMAQELEKMQRHYLNAGAEENRQLAQLQILYKARGRELEQLSSQVQVLQEEGAKEKRILNHQLAMTQTEKNGITVSYEQTQQLLAQSKEENIQLKGKLHTANAQIQSLNHAQQEMIQKLQTAESTIATLAQQLKELEKSQPLARAREHQETVMGEMQRRHQEEVTDLQGKLHRISTELQEKEEVLAGVQQNSELTRRGSEQAKLEHAETVNRLTAQLEESQRHCRDLLEKGSLQEINSLHQKLHQSKASKEINDHVCRTLQEEVKELKEQLSMYESALQLGVVAPISPESHNADGVVRNLAKEDWQIPSLPRLSKAQPMPHDEVLQRLRKELERSLTSNRSKRDKVSKLQEELRRSKSEAATWRQKTEQMERIIPESPSQSSNEMKADLNRLQIEIHTMKKDLEEKQATEAQLRKENTQLREQMASMVTDNDQDKKAALDRCQNTYLQLHEDSSKNLREELVTQFQTEKASLDEAHQQEIRQLREKLDVVLKELDKVKELYVKVCQEKNDIQDKVTETLRIENQNHIKELKLEYEEEKSRELSDLQLSLENAHKSLLLKFRTEKEAEMERLLKEKLVLAKAEWTHTARNEIAASEKQRAEDEVVRRVEDEVQRWMQSREGGDSQNVSLQTESLAPDWGDERRALINEKEEELRRLRMEAQNAKELALNKLREDMKHQQKTLIEAKQLVFKSQMDQLKHEHLDDIEQERSKQQEVIQQRLTDARTAWESVQKQREDRHKSKLQQLTREWTEEKKKLIEEYSLSKQESIRMAVEESKSELKRRYEAEVMQLKQRSNQNESALSKENESVTRRLRKALQDLENLSHNAEKADTLSKRQQTSRDKLEDEVSELRGKLCQAEQDNQQLEQRLNRELHYMQTRLKDANAMSAETLESRISDIQRRNRLSGSSQSNSDGQRKVSHTEMGVSSDELTTPIESNNQAHSECLLELKNQYLQTVRQIRADVFQYVKEVREHCQQTVRAEVEKERRETSKRLKQHFMKCLKDQLQEDQKMARNEKRRRSSVYMLTALNKFMEQRENAENTPPPQDGEKEDNNEEDYHPMQDVIQFQQDGRRQCPKDGRPTSVKPTPISFRDEVSSHEISNHESTIEIPRSADSTLDVSDAGVMSFLEEHDSDLMKRTFERLGVLDGSSDTDSIMRSISPHEDVVSMDEGSCSSSRSSGEFDHVGLRNKNVKTGVTPSRNRTSSRTDSKFGSTQRKYPDLAEKLSVNQYSEYKQQSSRYSLSEKSSKSANPIEKSHSSTYSGKLSSSKGEERLSGQNAERIVGKSSTSLRGGSKSSENLEDTYATKRTSGNRSSRELERNGSDLGSSLRISYSDDRISRHKTASNDEDRFFSKRTGKGNGETSHRTPSIRTLKSSVVDSEDLFKHHAEHSVFSEVKKSERQSVFEKEDMKRRYVEVKNPLPLVTRQTQASTPKPKVDLSSASVMTEYHDLPDRIEH